MSRYKRRVGFYDPTILFTKEVFKKEFGATELAVWFVNALCNALLVLSALIFVKRTSHKHKEMTSNNEFDVISSNTMVNAPNRAVFFLQTGKNGFCVTLDVPHTYILTVKNNGQNKVCLPFGPRWSLLQEEVFSERQPCDPGQTAQWNNGHRKSLCNASLIC